MSFAAATAVTRVAETVWRADINPGWDIAGNANGGYLLAIATRAAALTAGHPDPITVTAHYLRPGRTGPVTIETTLVRRGRRLSTVTATMLADGRPLLTTLGSFGELDTFGGPERVEATPPQIPDPDDCIRVEPTATFPPPFMANVDLRLHPEDVSHRGAAHKGVLRVRGWFRWPNGEAMDTMGTLVAVDAFPPTIFNADLPVAWTPTLELTAHHRAHPPREGWLRCAFTTRFITGGFLEEDGEVWNEKGRVVAQSRQLALLPRG